MAATHIIRKYLVVGIILLFIGTSVIPSATSEQTGGKKIIMVDDEPGDGEYTSIKEALNHSDPGDIIEVFSGTYTENDIQIFQPISIIGIPHELGAGNDTGKPVIKHLQQGNWSYFIIRIVNTERVSINGCVFIPYNESDIVKVIDMVSTNYCTLHNNDIYGNSWHGVGFDVWDCNNTAILNNTITNCVDGILIFHSYNMTILNNTITNIRNGVDVDLPLSRIYYNCSILNNCITNCSDQGISAEGSGITISQNVIKNCSGIGISFSGFSHIIMNRLYNCKSGMDISCEGGNIAGNLVSDCSVGMNIICESNNNTIQNNELRNNSLGMTIHEPGSLRVKVTQNNFIHNLKQVVITAVIPAFSNYIFRGNYWNHSLSHPKPIICYGLLIIFPLGRFIGIPVPWICFDLTPAQHPYEIP
jgi:parallel beta-helix repeat protein